MFIYLLTCTVNNKVYVGITKDFKERMRVHLKKSNGKYPINRAIKKHGWDNFTKEILFETDNYNDEITVIKLFNATNPDIGYNVSLGGMTPIHTEETKAKLREARLGTVTSEETKNKIKESLNKYYKNNPALKKDGCSADTLGVRIIKGKYSARITLNGVRTELGRYETEEEAAEVIKRFKETGIKPSRKTSKHKGVMFVSDKQRWMAKVKGKFLKYCKTEEEAYQAVLSHNTGTPCQN